jgi:hypothetical protein
MSARARGLAELDPGPWVRQGGDAQQDGGRVVNDEPHGRLAVGDREQFAGAGHIDEAQAGQVQVDFAGTARRQRGERGAPRIPGGKVGIADERQPGATGQCADGERARGQRGVRVVDHSQPPSTWGHLLPDARLRASVASL